MVTHFTPTEQPRGPEPESTLPRLEKPQLSASRVEVLELSERAVGVRFWLLRSVQGLKPWCQ